MTRRKSRPLLPHEAISNFHSNQGHPSLAPSSSLPTNISSQQQDQSSQSSVFSSQSTMNSGPPNRPVEVVTDAIVNNTEAPLGDLPTLENRNAAQEAKDDAHGSAKHTKLSASLDTNAQKPNDQPISLIRSLSQTLPQKRRPGYFADRRRASFMIHDEHKAIAHSSCSINDLRRNTNQDLARPSQPLKRASSLVRLSLSLDGKAEVTTRTGNTPSPPRSRPGDAAPRPHNGLQRSYSALEPSNKSGQGLPTIPIPRRPMAGRSKDARTWEFYCDSDARNALTEQAEREESGSATAAISLIRSHSQNNKVMASNPNKRNAHTQKPEITKRLKADQRPSKPKLARAISSIARLQSTNGHQVKQQVVHKPHKHSKSGSQIIIREGDEDSDKENWEPGTQTSNPRRRRPMIPNQGARILEESRFVPSQSTSLDTLMHRENTKTSRSSAKDSSSEEKETSVPIMDDEVAVFMGEPVPREVEDLDCVQNLLSLSQAAWQ